MRRVKDLLAQILHACSSGIQKSRRWRVVFVLLLFFSTILPLNLIANWTRVEAIPCPCNVFGSPTGQSEFTDVGLELGFKFQSNINGFITGVRFYKQGSMGGTHTGHIWTTGGTELATAVFTESASGWQEVTFSSAVAVTANTNYVASVTMADGHYIATSNYFTSDITNDPLTAPSSAGSGGNGVFNTTAGSFPNSTFNSTNYWIDVAFVGNTGSTPPTVSSTSPMTSATNATPGETVTATFDEAMNPSSFTSSTFEVRDASNTVVSGSRSYTGSTKTASFVATAEFSLGQTYTVTLHGGSGTTVQNLEGIAMAANYTWSFTITTTNACPCSLEDRAAPGSTSGSFDDTGALELGVKLKPTTNGYVTALRFYKPITSTETTHTGRIWDSSGTELASVTFSTETDYGWQEARLSTPLQVSQGQLYVVSYGTTTAVYQATNNALTGTNISNGYLTAYADNSSENTATGSTTHNGVYTTTAGSYPSTGSTNGTYYWVDAVFATSSSPTYPLSVKQTQPTSSAFGIAKDTAVSASFNRVLDSSTVTNSSFRLFDSSSNQVTGTSTYNTTTGEATFTPSSNLTNGASYTAKLSASIADPAGTTLGSEYSWSFTVGSALSSDPTTGPGGPILVVTTTSDKYDTYYAEILRTEGLNYFDVKDISTVSASTLGNYNAVVLGEMTLTQDQADMFSTWVNAGGNLVAMRPDSKLVGLLGLTAVGSTRSDQYLLIDTSTTEGSGLVNETIQFKGTADNYTLNGSSALATFYSDASTSTSNPAVTTRPVGGNGGTAVAFAYDLAKSDVALHQGNQAWVGNDRDGIAPVRGNDLFFGAKIGDVQPDWIDANKFGIPQADEQQRLLANILINAVKDTRPLPRFWYLPGDYKAAMVLAGDEHGLATASLTTLNKWLNDSQTDCSLEDWKCVRATHYIYATSGLTDAKALQFNDLGFEIGDHVQNGCSNFSSLSNLEATYTGDLATWRAKYTSMPNQKTHRFHCYVWSDWDSQAKAELANNMRYTLDYLVYPSSWVSSKVPIMTSSGMNMRFADADGDLLNIYQGVTNMDNTTAGASAINTLFDNATGSTGYYGIYGTHYDMSDTYDDTLYAQATANNIPIITSVQALTWLDGRNSSTFSGFSGSNGQFSFTISAAEGASNLKAMLPVQDAGGTLSSLSRGGSSVSYTTSAVKGISYAVFSGVPGTYIATYSDYSPATSSSSSPSSSTSKKTTASSEVTEEVATTTEAEKQASKPSEKEIVTEAGNGGRFAWVKWVIIVGVGGLALFVITVFIRHRRPPEITF